MSQNHVALCRLAQVDEARGKLQEALTHAERQLAASEARVTNLQAAVEKSEERAASLDLQVKAKSNPASGKHHFFSPLTLSLHHTETLLALNVSCPRELISQPVCRQLLQETPRAQCSELTCSSLAVCPGSGGATGAGSNQEAELSRTIAALRKDVAEAQQQAAQEAGHVAQYRSLAEGAEENTRIVQVSCHVCSSGSGANHTAPCCACKQVVLSHT